MQGDYSKLGKGIGEDAIPGRTPEAGDQFQKKQIEMQNNAAAAGETQLMRAISDLQKVEQQLQQQYEKLGVSMDGLSRSMNDQTDLSQRWFRSGS
jgi:uncharacterized protein with von Willebrand factor type A (vWA) domain